MCKYCEPLNDCPVGDIRSTILGKETDKYGMPMRMVIDRSNDRDKTFIYGFLNVRHSIDYCPICGEKIKTR